MVDSGNNSRSNETWVHSIYDAVITEDDLQRQLMGYKMAGLETGNLKFIGASNFKVFRYRMGLEKFAVKTIPTLGRGNSSRRKKILQEMHTLLRCNGSTHILRFVGWQEDDDPTDPSKSCIHIAMEYCEGGTLSTWMASDEERSLETLFQMLKGIVAGVWFIHFKGIIHNDIKPDNVLISRGIPMISDFGSATPPGQPIVGTEGFKCPESTLADEKSDTFALGITVYQMYSGKTRRITEPYKLKLTSSNVPDKRVREILEYVIVPKAERLTVKEIVSEFPHTSSIDSNPSDNTNISSTDAPNPVPPVAPAEPDHSIPSVDTFAIHSPPIEPQRPRTPNLPPPQSPQPVPQDRTSAPDEPSTVTQISRGPSKLQRFPFIQDFWRMTLGSTNDSVGMEVFLDALRSVLSPEVAALLNWESEEFAKFVRHIADDADSPVSVSPRSFGAFLVGYPDTETDTLSSAIIKVFIEFQKETAGTVGSVVDGVAAALEALSFLGNAHQLIKVNPRGVWEKAKSGDKQCCVVVAGLVAFGRNGIPKDIVQAASLLGHGLEMNSHIKASDFTDCSTDRFLFNGNEWIASRVEPIGVDGPGQITTLILSGRSLAITFPQMVTQLISLTYLDLTETGLSGTIPIEICQLTQLEELYLCRNQLSGEIPRELGQLSKLKTLSMHENKLTGSIPAELSQLSCLQFMYLNDNELAGWIPRGFGQLSELRELMLYKNNLTGVVPTELAQLKKLQLLMLYSNKLGGTIPSQLGELSELTKLYLYDNELHGNIPVELAKLPQLEELALRNNQLTGVIPKELGNISILKHLSLGNNNLKGIIPKELGQLRQLQSLSLRDNELVGSIPPELGQLIQLNQLSLFKNQLTGNIPRELENLRQLEYLFLQDNMLTGNIPRELGRLTRLQQLRLNNNRLTGVVPDQVKALRCVVKDLSENPGLVQ